MPIFGIEKPNWTVGKPCSQLEKLNYFSRHEVTAAPVESAASNAPFGVAGRAIEQRQFAAAAAGSGRQMAASFWLTHASGKHPP